MDQKDIAYAISKGGRQPFVTITDIAERMGVSSKTARRHMQDMEINAVNGKYYLAKEIAEGFAKRLQSKGV